MSQLYIRSVLTKRLKEWADTQVPPVPLALENIAFNKPSSISPYLEVFLLPASTINPTVDGTRKREIGIFQINVWSNDNRGTGIGEQIAEQIVQLFPLVPKFSDVSVERTPSISQGMLEEGWRVIPISISYRYES